MSRETAELLKAFEALPESEKREFTAEFLRVAIPYDSGAIEDEEVGMAGRALFATLDQEDNGPSARWQQG
jgi:hypothetical protein